MRPPSNSWNSSRQILGIARASCEVSDLNREMELLPELCSLITRHAGRGRIATARTSIPGLKVVASSVTTEPINHVYEPLFGLVVPGAKRILLGDRMLDYGAGQYLVVSVDLPITSHIDVSSAEEPFLSIGLMLKPAAISTLLLDAATNDRAAVAPSGIGVSEAPVELLEAVVRLLRLLDHPRDISGAVQGALSPLQVRYLHNRVDML